MSYTETALHLLKYLPRVSLGNIVKNPMAKKRKYTRGQYAWSGRKGFGQKGMLQRQKFLPPGYDAHSVPFYLRVPIENYYKDITHRKQYMPLTMHQLQLMIDTGALDITQPIDLSSLCGTNFFHIDPNDNQYGANLTDVGLDYFKAKVNIEVQHASEPVIAAIERNGGTIRCAFYDIISVSCLVKPMEFFKKGEPIPKRLLPPPDSIELYTDPKKRGYLADPNEVAKERLLLAQKYGYDLPNIEQDPSYNMLSAQKDPRQIFFGLNPGWMINLRDRMVHEATDEELQKYYHQ